MLIIPAIYILDGKTVALYKGDFSQKEVYSRSPVEYAREFVDRGATNLLLIDLNASEYGKNDNDAIVQEIRKNVEVNIIYAGGVRTMDRVDALFAMGISQVVLGVSAEDIYQAALEKYSADKIIVGIKSKGDVVQTDKKLPTVLRVIDFAETLTAKGVKTILLKDLLREGTGINPNYDEMERALLLTSLRVYVSGGIGKMKNLEILQETGAHGAAIGKSLYERNLDLAECIEKFQN